MLFSEAATPRDQIAAIIPADVGAVIAGGGGIEMVNQIEKIADLTCPVLVKTQGTLLKEDDAYAKATAFHRPAPICTARVPFHASSVVTIHFEDIRDTPSWPLFFLMSGGQIVSEVGRSPPPSLVERCRGSPMLIAPA